jgi:hypothetical protein
LIDTIDSTILSSNFFSSTSLSPSEDTQLIESPRESKHKTVMLGTNKLKHKCSNKKIDNVFFNFFYKDTKDLAGLKEIIF